MVYKEARYVPFLLSFVIIFLSSSIIHSQEMMEGKVLKHKMARWEIRANRITHLRDEDLYIAEGDVVITRNGQILLADKAIYNSNTGITEISGNVILKLNGNIMRADRALIDLNNHQGQIKKARLFIKENHLYISGDVVEKIGENTYRLRRCKVTACDGENPDWSITGSMVKVTIDGYGTAHGAAFRIKGVPVFYLPWAVFPVKRKRQTGFLFPRLGYGEGRGMDIELPFFWAISDSVDATFYERFMGKRGFMQGLEFRYAGIEQSKGIFLMDIISDRRKEKDLDDVEQAELSPYPRTNSTRYWLRGRFNQLLPDDIWARGDIDYLSDQDYLKEFSGGLYGSDPRPELNNEFGRPIDDIFSATRSSRIKLSKKGENYTLEVGGAYYQRPENLPNDTTPQPIGGVDFSILPKNMTHLPISFRLDTDYDYIWRESGQRGHRSSIFPELSYSLWYSPYLEFEPSIGFEVNSRSFESPDMGHSTQYSPVIKGRVSSRIEKVFHGPILGFEALKHKIQPSLEYEYRDFHQDSYHPWFEPLDEQDGINRITLSLLNRLDGKRVLKHGSTRYSRWGILDLRQPYSIKEARRDEEPWREKRPFLPLEAIARFYPLDSFELETSATWDHYTDEIASADLLFQFLVERGGGKKDTYQLEYQYISGDMENINYLLNINLGGGFSAGTSMRRELNFDDTLESNYWLDYESQCWAVRFSAGSLDGVDSVMLTIRLKGLGEL